MGEVTIAALIMLSPTVIAGVAVFIAFRAWSGMNDLRRSYMLMSKRHAEMAERLRTLLDRLEGGDHG